MDCAEQAAFNKKDLSDKAIKEMAEKFFEAIKQAIKAQGIFFQKGVLKKKELNKVKIVLAVIDDRNIERLLDQIKATERAIAECKKKKIDSTNKEKLEQLEKELEQENKSKKNLKVNEKNTNPVFKNQDLWGLDRTRSLVQTYGLGFNLVVINEDEASGWDAFGTITEKKAYSDVPQDSDEDSQHSDHGKGGEDDSSSSAKSGEVDLEGLFKKSKAIDKSSFDIGKAQKLNFAGPVNPAAGIFQSYLTCPTIGDGDCFFHAAFTDDGEDSQTVSQCASQMRIDFCDAVQGNEYLDECRNLLYEHFLELSSKNQYGGIPDDIASWFQENDTYVDARNKLISLGIDPAEQLKEEYLHSSDDIKALIDDDSIKMYMEILRIVGGEDTYIPVRPDMKCPAELIAERNDRRINIFTFNKATGNLDLLKSVGDNGTIVNILIEGRHFVRLHTPAESDDHRLQAEQIIGNYSQV